MRLRRDRFARGLSFAALVAALALFATEQTSAQSRNRGGFSQSKGSFSTQRYVQPRSTAVPSGRLSATKPNKGKVGIPTLPPGATGAARPPRTPPGPVVGDKNPPGGGTTRPPRPDRPRPDRPPRPGSP